MGFDGDFVDESNPLSFQRQIEDSRKRTREGYIAGLGRFKKEGSGSSGGGNSKSSGAGK